MQMIRVIVISPDDQRIVVDKECDFDTVEGRRYIAEHAQRAMANNEAVLTIPADVHNPVSRLADVLSRY